MIVGRTNQPLEESYVPPATIFASLDTFAASIAPAWSLNPASSMTAPMKLPKSAGSPTFIPSTSERSSSLDLRPEVRGT